jgi:ribonuclease HI
LKHVIIHTDGGCEPNPGPGGWAAVLETDGRIRELSGSDPATTNNRMEMQAAIEALRALPEPSRVELFTDSQYLRKGICEWLKGWKARGWKTAEKQPVKNQDLWRQLDTLTAGHTISWRWLKGHVGHKLNERCDELAGMEIAKLRRQARAPQPAAIRTPVTPVNQTALIQASLF